jgi:8-oxo-dGTP pyrophosphatase MutT (NUDIX family)
MTLTQSARSMLDSWSAPDDEQRTLRDDFLNHIDAHDLPWSRDCRPDHLTASLLVVDTSRTHVLLGLHRKVGLWLQFGGHLEASDASIPDAALREACEESGLTELTLMSAEPVRLDRHDAPCASNARHHLDVQLAGVADRSDRLTVSEESLAVRWFEVGRLPEHTDDAVRRLVSMACRGSV